MQFASCQRTICLIRTRILHANCSREHSVFYKVLLLFLSLSFLIPFSSHFSLCETVLIQFYFLFFFLLDSNVRPRFSSFSPTLPQREFLYKDKEQDIYNRTSLHFEVNRTLRFLFISNLRNRFVHKL